MGNSSLTFIFFLRFCLLKRTVFVEYLKEIFKDIKKVFVCLAIFGGVIACSHREKIKTPVVLPITLVGNDTVLVDGNSVTLLYSQESNNNGFSLVFQDVGDLGCDAVSLAITAPYGLVPKNDVFKPYFESCMSDCGSKWQYTCTKSSNNIILTEGPPRFNDGFRPWADNFNISLGATTFTFNVQTDIPLANKQLLNRGATATMVLSPAFQGCGLYGTILQRVFDCSKKVINSAVYVDPVGSVFNNSANPNADGTSSFYTLFSPALNNTYEHYADPYWFVVACPNSFGISDIPQQQCAWLTPTVTSNNPAIEKPGLYQTFGYDMLTGYQKRFLLGGMLDNAGAGFTFEEANGFKIENAQNYYTTLGFGTPTPPPAPTIFPSVCASLTGNFLFNATSIFLKSDQVVRDLISYNSGATVSWKMPSYPMLNTLTGGTSTGLNPGGGGCMTGGAWTAPFCNTTDTGNVYFFSTAFNAINVPGFLSSQVQNTVDIKGLLWSSSISTLLDSSHNPYGYVLAALTQVGAGYTSVANNNPPPTNLAVVRCSSLSWY